MSNATSAALRLQSSIVHALILQDMSQRYARTRLGALTAIIEPLVMVGSLYLLRYLTSGSTVHGMPLALFIASGFLPVYGFRLVASAVMAATSRRAAARLFPQITSFDIILAQAIASTLISAATMMLAFAIAVLLTGVPPADLLTMFVACWLILMLAAAFGLLIGVVLRRLPGFVLIVSALLRVNMMLAGAGFLGTEIPPKLLPLITWNPTFHCVELLREGWLHFYESPFADWGYVLVCTLAMLAIALPLERLSGRTLFS